MVMHVLLSTLMILIGCCFALAALRSNPDTQWRNMTGFYSSALLLSFVYLIVKLATDAEPMIWFNSSVLTDLMLPLVSFIALILTRYSKTYLDGQPSVGYFQRWFALALLSVWGVLSSNHMLMFFLAWVAISLCFHRLLMIFPERPRAALAAHKKYIFARFAEISLFGAFCVFYLHWQSPWISDWTEAAKSLQSLPISLSVGAILLVMTAMIKCAQLPIHGWLIQVVESPTPVSALLHAGIVNLGGFLIILFAPIVNLSNPAIWLLLVWSGLSVVVAALIMHTRISVKVRLAWSTSAQMGFMLLECALGYYELAILHLLAHSLYKAYAFLNASSEVNSYLNRQLTKQSKKSIKRTFGFILLSVGFVWLWHQVYPVHPAMAVLYVIVFTVLFNSLGRVGNRWLSIPVAASVFVLLYAIQQLGLSQLLVLPVQELSVWKLVWVSALFVVLGVLYWLLRLAPNHPQSRQFYRLLYAGFYLDEWSTRLTLAIWPTELPKRQSEERKILPTGDA